MSRESRGAGKGGRKRGQEQGREGRVPRLTRSPQGSEKTIHLVRRFLVYSIARPQQAFQRHMSREGRGAGKGSRGREWKGRVAGQRWEEEQEKRAEAEQGKKGTGKEKEDEQKKGAEAGQGREGTGAEREEEQEKEAQTGQGREGT